MLKALRYVSLRLRRYPEASPIAQELIERRRELSDAQDTFDLTHTASLAANAEVGYRDDAVDRAVLTLAAEAFRWVSKNAEDPRYKKLFPVPPEQATASTAGRKQNEFVEQLLVTLRTAQEFLPLVAHADVLEQTQRALMTALAERDGSSLPQQQASLQRSEAARLACHSYNRSPARLQLIFSDGRLIESFFPALPESNARESNY